MPESIIHLYEGLFLMNQEVAADVNTALPKIREILENRGAEIVALRKWDERRLAYPIKGQKRGLYLLGLFRVAGSEIARIERDCHLSDEVLRVMMTRADHLGEVEIEQAVQEGQTTADEAAIRGEEGEAQPVAAGAGEGEGAKESEKKEG